MTEILTRYLVYNAHAASYTWKYNGTNLDMAKTLEDNGVKDEDEEFYELSIRDDQFLPAIHLYFNDDLTEAWIGSIFANLLIKKLIEWMNEWLNEWMIDWLNDQMVDWCSDWSNGWLIDQVIDLFIGWAINWVAYQWSTIWLMYRLTHPFDNQLIG